MRGVLRAVSIEIVGPRCCYAVLEGPEGLIDVRSRTVKGDTSVFLAVLDRLLDTFRPDLLVLEEPAGARKSGRSRDWLAWAEQRAHERKLGTRAIPGTVLRAHFRETGGERHDIAVAIARQFPELAPKLPERRKAWESEARAIGIFISVARGVAALS